jgi:hypothetical protein
VKVWARFYFKPHALITILMWVYLWSGNVLLALASAREALDDIPAAKTACSDAMKAFETVFFSVLQYMQLHHLLPGWKCAVCCECSAAFGSLGCAVTKYDGANLYSVR